VAGKIKAALADLINHEDTDNIPVLFSGGISERNDMLFPLIEKHLPENMCHLMRLEIEPVDGAIAHAKKIFELRNGTEEKKTI
jgi:hypothetical protein